MVLSDGIERDSLLTKTHTRSIPKPSAEGDLDATIGSFLEGEELPGADLVHREYPALE